MSETPRDQRALWREVSRTFEEFGEALRVHLSPDAARTPSDPTTPPGHPGTGSDQAGSADPAQTEPAPWADPAPSGQAERFDDPWAAATDSPTRAPASGTATPGTATPGTATPGSATPGTAGPGADGTTVDGAATAATGSTGTGPGGTTETTTADTTSWSDATAAGSARGRATESTAAGAGATGEAGTTASSGAGDTTSRATGTGAGAAGGTGTTGTGAGAAGGAGTTGPGAGGAQDRGWREWTGTSGGGRFAGPADWDSARESVRDLGGSVRRIATQAGDAARDPHVRDSAQRAARSLGDAIVTTVEDLAAELRERMRNTRWSDPSGPPEPPPVAPIEDNRDDKP